ncbi:MAG: hypothetical protein ACLUHN_06155 [Evtepia gabavorous]
MSAPSAAARAAASRTAPGGGKDPLKLDDALASVDDFVAVKLGL